MSRPSIAPGLRLTFLVHSIAAGVVGLQHLLAPRLWTDLAGMEITETVTWRVIGAALLGFAASSWMAYRESEWHKVRIVVVMEIVWSILAALAVLWCLLVEQLAPLEWVNVVLLVGFAIVFGVYLRKHAA
jgi:hypothetical protein